MNINYETYIKQEFANAVDEVNTTLPVPDLKIQIKNEPISDDILPLVTIKNEPLNEAKLTETSYNIKSEDFAQNHLPVPTDSFVIYELQTPTISKQIQHIENKPNTRQIINKSTELNTITNITPLSSLAAKSVKAKQSIQIPANSNDTHNSTSESAATLPPVLLNAKLRKRKKVVIPENPIDKRTRYNIKGTKIGSGKNSIAVVTDLLGGGDKKIINHLIKNKRNQKKFTDCTIAQLENSSDLESKHFFSKSREIQSEILFSNVPESRVNFASNDEDIKKEFLVNSKTSTAISATDLNAPKNISNTPELRVKCLCSLTADTSDNKTHTFELRDFFQQMFERTRRLNKKQQRVIKMKLLQAILDAENSVELGKCCSF